MKLFCKLFVLLFLAAFINSVNGAEPQLWTINTRNDFLKGNSKGVAVTDNGELFVAPRLNEIFDTQQAYVWSSAADRNGNVFLGTGTDGKIFRVGADNKNSLFADLDEINVAALVIGKDGSLFAGTAPDGKVYRISKDGKAEIYFDPKEKYIWSLAMFEDGSLMVATGENGKIFRVRQANETPEKTLFYDSGEAHIISLATDRQENLIAGTDRSGIVLRLTKEGKAFALLDSPLREIHEIEIGADGSIYALAVGEQASAGNSTNLAAPIQTGGTPAASVSIIGVISSEVPNETPRSKNNLENAKSAVYRILPDGGFDIIWSSNSVTAFSIVQKENDILIGTADKGRIYQVTRDGRETLVSQSDEAQISTILQNNREIFATSSNQGKVFRFENQTPGEGVYESPVRDARADALWGRINVRGEGVIRVETRTGNTENPDATWSMWQAVTADNGSVGGQIGSPRARFLQWRVRLQTAARVREVAVSFIQRNIAPEVTSVSLLPLNVGLQENFSQPEDPNIAISRINPSVFGQNNAATPPRKIYQRGAVSLQWTAEDRNGDQLIYSISYRKIDETRFQILKENIRENFFTADSTALSDGKYIFRVTASDAPSNAFGQALSGEQTTEPLEIDNTAPTISVTNPPRIVNGRLNFGFTANDPNGTIRRAEVSFNGSDWSALAPVDGIADSFREIFSFSENVNASLVSVRIYDGNGNVAAIRLAVN